MFAVGNGPSGTAFYRLSDADGDGKAEKVETLFKFKGGMGEHGPHAPILGPDGLIYIMIGNHAFVEAGHRAPPARTITTTTRELFTPKYEDANGHAAGIKAPGGTVVRTDTNGSFIELFVGGFRNAYDHAFNRDGELFTFDSDMEWDVGVALVSADARESPDARGRVRLAQRLVDMAGLFRRQPARDDRHRPRLADRRRVLRPRSLSPQVSRRAVHVRLVAGSHPGGDAGARSAARTKAQSEIFLEGRPLNCSDIDVGPDGWLYFCVGGRNTAGSIFRVVSQEAAPAARRRPAAAAASRRPSNSRNSSSAWARRAVRDVKKEVGDQWGPGLAAVAVNAQAPPRRSRAGARPDAAFFAARRPTALLVQLSNDDNAAGARQGDLPAGHSRDAGLERAAGANCSDDADPNVRRLACESLVRARSPGARSSKLLALMAEPNRFVAWAARRALEQLPKDQWQSAVLASSNLRVFIMGSVALVTLDADRATAGAILEPGGKWLDQSRRDDDLLDLLRVVELALHRGDFSGGRTSGAAEPDFGPLSRRAIIA